MTKLALLTGGSRGIGKATVDILREHGWDVLTPTRAELDFGSYESYRGLLQQWANRGIPVLDALIFCHGDWYSKPLAEHLGGDFFTQYLSRVMLPIDLAGFLVHGFPDSSPKIVIMISSTQAFGGRANTLPYAVACAAQVRAMQGLAQSFNGTRFNIICPGLTDTDMAAQVRASGDCKPDAVAQPASVVAAAIVGLIEGDANGKVLRVVDGVTTEAKWSW